MELHGSGYLYTLGVIATTFAGFAGLTVIFREIMGGKLSRLDGFVIRTFIQLGFLATAGSMIPPLLHLFGLEPQTIWRTSSIVMAILLGAWSLSFPRRRRSASPTRVPLPIWVVIGILDMAALALVANAIWPAGHYATGIYAAAVTINLVGGATFFLFSLIFLFAKPLEVQTPAPNE
jgi:hypothetical protein